MIPTKGDFGMTNKTQDFLLQTNNGHDNKYDQALVVHLTISSKEVITTTILVTDKNMAHFLPNSLW